MSLDYDVWVVCDDCGEREPGWHEEADSVWLNDDVEGADKWALCSIPKLPEDALLWGGINHVCPECCAKRGWTVEDNYVVKHG